MSVYARSFARRRLRENLGTMGATWDTHVVVLSHLIGMVFEHTLPVGLLDICLGSAKTKILEAEHLIVVLFVAHRCQGCKMASVY